MDEAMGEDSLGLESILEKVRGAKKSVKIGICLPLHPLKEAAKEKEE